MKVWLSESWLTVMVTVSPASAEPTLAQPPETVMLWASPHAAVLAVGGLNAGGLSLGQANDGAVAEGGGEKVELTLV